MSETTTTGRGVLDISCAACGAPAVYDIARQSYVCRYCGASTGVREDAEKKEEYRRLLRVRLKQTAPAFHAQKASCTGCGARIIFPENEALAACAFCGRQLVRGGYPGSADFPELLIPFAVTPEEAKKNLLSWCAAAPRRKEAKEIEANIDRLEGFYLPYLAVRGPVECGVRREHTERLYRCRGFVDGRFVNTSSNLSNPVLDGMEPYDTGALRPFDFSFLAGQRVKTADLKGKDAAARVQDEIAADYEPFAAKTLQTRAVRVTPNTEDLTVMTAVLPAYYLQAGGTVAAVNGQTGKVAVLEEKERVLPPWQLKPAAAILILAALTFLGAFFATRETQKALLFTGALSLIFLPVLLTAYSNQYGGSRRFRLRRRVLTSGKRAPKTAPPVFYETLRGEARPVKLKFETPLRTLRLLLATLTVMFLPLVLAFLLNGCAVQGLHPAGAAVWLCIFVPVGPVYYIKFGRMHLHERPLIYTPDKRGRMRRYRRPADPKRTWRALRKTLLRPAGLLAVLLALVLLLISTALTLEQDGNSAAPPPAEAAPAHTTTVQDLP